MDKEIVIIKGYRGTRRKLKLIAALNAKTIQDYLEEIIDKNYASSIKKESTR